MKDREWTRPQALSVLSPQLKIFSADQVDSTNRLAKDFAKGITDPLIPESEKFSEDYHYLFVADGQSGGKGRLGRRFVSDSGVGLYMSYLFKPKLPPAELTTLTAYAAVCAANAIERLCGGEVGIKWVNDIYIGGKKAAGILTESALTPAGEVAYAIVGIGINVKKRNFGELSEIATSLEESLGVCPDRSELALLISEGLRKFDTADKKEYMNEYKRRSTVLGKEITVNPISGEPYAARAVDIDESGELILENEKNERFSISAADVSIRVRS
jgi:BirA family biotin operon repressor/biotin-[acetyl-CoA-carboxylase] ligase